MIVEIAKNIISNISMLVLIAYLLTKVRLVREFILDETDHLYPKLMMAVIFGLIGILSTYTGSQVQGAIANTRVIGVIAGGLLGGPLVGLIAGIIAGGHRFLIDIGGFTAVACAISTILEGLIGGMFFRRRRGDENWLATAGVTVLAEAVQMGTILVIAKPFAEAWRLVEVISLPMILFNSLGVSFFIGIFDSVFLEEDRQAAAHIRMAMSIADYCLPHLRKGLHDRAHITEAANIIRERANTAGAIITDQKEIVGSSFEKGLTLKSDRMPEVAARVLLQKISCAGGDETQQELCGKRQKKLTAIGAPLTRGDEVVGTLVLFIRRYKLTKEVNFDFVSGLARLFSTQLALSEVEYQKKLLQRAEFAALQSQINPHFLFNALSTITAFCREKPERARELLIVLSDYFRNTLQTGDYMIALDSEMKHVSAYLELEKARFEEKLQVEIHINEGGNCIVPSFSLQPLVENAVKHGAMKRPDGNGKVRIALRRMPEEYLILVEDNGAGIPPQIISQLEQRTLSGNSVGLSNVDNRLRSIYGGDYGLRIESSPQGSRVTMRIPATSGVKEEEQ